MRKFANSIKRVAFRWYQNLVDALNRNDKIITAIATLILAITTLFLWLATRDLVKDARDTAKIQLQAYVFTLDPEIRDISTTKLVKAILTIKNSGQTPAEDVQAVGGVYYGGVENISDSTQPADKSRKTPTLLSPGGTTQFIIGGDRLLTKEQYNAIAAGQAAIFVIGTIDYKDIFNRKRHTKFSYYYTGNKLQPLNEDSNVVTLSNTDKNNEAD